MAIEKISRGVTFKGVTSTIGLVVFVVSLLVTLTGVFNGFSFVAIMIGSVLTLIGFMLFLSIRGVVIDTEQNRVKSYVYFFGHIGTWKSLALYDKIVLRYLNESQTMYNRSVSVTYKSRGFDILLGSASKPEIMVKEFTDYDAAKVFLSAYAKKLGKAEVNAYEQMKEQLQKRRQQMRR
jgi:hypothetical protein